MKKTSREKNSHIFLNLFSRLSEMKPRSRLGTMEIPGSRDAWLGKVLGSIIVGSCANDEKYFQVNEGPKDIDIVVVLGDSPNPPAERFVEELRIAFDLEYGRHTSNIELGRLDFLGFINSNETSHNPYLSLAIRRANVPEVYAFNKESAIKISEIINRIRTQNQ